MTECKIVVAGGGAVGKSALTIQFVQRQFITSYDPTVEDSYRKTVDLDGTPVVLDILDTAGQEEYSFLRDQYYKHGDGFLLVYSIIDQNSFTEITRFRDAIVRANDSDDVPIVIAGNKVDLEDARVVPNADGHELGRNLKCKFWETSAKTGVNVVHSFIELARDIYKKRNPGLTSSSDPTSTPKPKERRRCAIL
mmetsp:Transcript_12280/g.13580  ORF Transcript_12280/g.13580 Transcript_12280/m.13580 type:complete len:194 (-) Transcript_12280:44-625(-)